ncbi:MAG: hypothetical protein IT384_17550 [Deltaproteobacteria bacterium]|nr:hypothetical protein [Deltaproteobacteria bacterium]
MAIEAPRTAPLRTKDLQQQILDSKPGSVIHLPAGTLRGTLVINKSITLRGAGADQTILDGNGRGPVIAVDAPGAEVQIEELAIVGGRAGAGGAISVDNGAKVTVVGCLLQRNLARTGRGGAIAVDHGSVSVRECTLLDNRAQLGGAIFVGGSAKVEISATIIADNVGVRGGAIAAIEGADLEVWTCRLERNHAEIEGHHLYAYGTLARTPRVALSNTLLGAVDAGGLAIANHRSLKATLVLEDTSVARDFLPSVLIG